MVILGGTEIKYFIYFQRLSTSVFPCQVSARARHICVVAVVRIARSITAKAKPIPLIVFNFKVKVWNSFNQ